MSDVQNQFIAVCPECATILKVNFNKLGQNVRCSQCRHTFIAGEAIDPATQRSGEQPAVPLPSAPPSEPVERIAAVCPGCKATLHVRRAYIGNDVCCKHCNQAFRVRAPAETPAPTVEKQPEAQSNALQAQHEQLYVAHNLLQADHDRLKTEYTALGADLHRVTTELATIRAALGTIAPEEVEALANDRRSLGEEIHRLRDQMDALLTAESERDQLIAERQQWASELDKVQSERDLLANQLGERDDHLAAARAVQEHFKAEHEASLSEVEQLRAALAQHHEATYHERDRLRSEVEALRRSLDLAEHSQREELSRLNDQLAAQQEQHRQLQEQYDLAQERPDPTDASNVASEGAQPEPWIGQLPVVGVVSDENGAKTDPSSTAVLTSAGEPSAMAAELEDVRAQLAEMSQRLEQSEEVNRQMSAVLAGMGIRCRPMRV